jgi:hypothetical protein
MHYKIINMKIVKTGDQFTFNRSNLSGMRKFLSEARFGEHDNPVGIRTNPL